MSGSAGSVKDVLLEHVSRDVKQLQSLQSDMATVVDMVTNSNRHVQSLCEHLDRILMHGVREYEGGYWSFVRYFTRSEAVHTLTTLAKVHMDIGRARAWLYLALNEQAMESYVRMFMENQDVAKTYYLQEAFIRDEEHLLVLQTLMSGLDFISFDLLVDCDYLDYGPTEPSSRLGISRGAEFTPDIQPTFIGTVPLGCSLAATVPGTVLTQGDQLSDSLEALPPAAIVPPGIVPPAIVPPGIVPPAIAASVVMPAHSSFGNSEESLVVRISKHKKSKRKKKKKSKDAGPSKVVSEGDSVDGPVSASTHPVEDVPLVETGNQGISPSNEEPSTDAPPSPSPTETTPSVEGLKPPSPICTSDTDKPAAVEQGEPPSACNVVSVEKGESPSPGTTSNLNSPRVSRHSSMEGEDPLLIESDSMDAPPVDNDTMLRSTSDPSMTAHLLHSEPRPGAGSPHRPLNISEGDKRAADVLIDENTRLVFSLEILLEDEEETHRLVQVATPAGVGLQRSAYVLITSKAVYLLRKDGIEGIYSREIGIRYSQFDHIVIGLGWQSLILVYYPHPSLELTQSLGGVGGSSERCVLLTGREGVSRGLVESVCACAAHCPGFLKSIPLNRDDEVRLEAIEKELIKLGSQTSMDIVRYSLVNWEQISGEPPPSVAKATTRRNSVNGWLHVKSANVLGMPVWKHYYFELRRGCLYQYVGEGDSVAKSVYTIHNCGGCTRVTGEGKPYTISVIDREGTSLIIAAANEEELTRWLQALCEAVIGNETRSSPKQLRTCLNCALLLTHNMLHILLEDWTNDSVQLVTSCRVTDVNDISVDNTLPLYCTVAYDHGASQGLWLICFNSEYELGKFENALSQTWREEFQVSLKFSQLEDIQLRQKAHRAVELMQNSRYRSDSITRGRSEFTYSAAF